METAQDLAERYAAVWNERDAAARRAAIARLWMSEGVHFVSTREVRGYDALEERITTSHEKNVRDEGNVFRVRKDAQRLQDVVTFTWEMVPAGKSDVLAVGLEVLRLDGSGRIIADYQFILA
jgi:hypothetical protein